jgi:ATP adenylyltransferase
MQRKALYAPWRMEYIRSLGKSDQEGRCFLCEAAGADEVQRQVRFVLWQTPHVLVMMNAFPYTNGHLLIAPRAHKAELEELTPEEAQDLMLQTADAVRLLKRAVSAQGFNIGINLSRCAGAGVPGHLHQHVVPRWSGDMNFMQIVGEVSVVPESVSKLYDELVRVREEMVREGR